MLETLKLVQPHLDALTSSPLFQNFKMHDLVNFLSKFDKCQLKDGDIVFHEGAQSTDMSILLDGKVCIYKKETIISILQAPAVIGEIGLFTETPRNASVKAEGDALTIVINRADLNSFFISHPGLSSITYRNVILCMRNKINNDNQRILSLQNEIAELKEGYVGNERITHNKRDNLRVTVTQSTLCNVIIDNSNFDVSDISLTGMNIQIKNNPMFKENNWREGSVFEGEICLLDHSPIPFFGTIMKLSDNSCGIKFNKVFSLPHEKAIIDMINKLNRLGQLA